MDEPRRALVLRPDNQEAATLAHTDIKALAADIEAWVATWNDNPRPFTWHRTADEIPGKLARYCTALTGNE